MARSWKFTAVLLSAIAAAPLVAYAAICLNAQLFGNIHPLPGNDLYRSGQLSYNQLQDTIAHYKIRSILNLRGGNYDNQWYQDEVMLSKSLGVEHIDYALSSKREITDPQAQNVLTFIQNAPKPLLIHCQHGADRTGVVSALYVKYILNKPVEEAWHQLSWRFAHLRYSLSGKDPMDSGFKRIVNNPNFTTPPYTAKGTAP